MQAANKHMPAETTNCRVGNCPAETSHYRGQDLRQVRDSGTSQLRDKASRQQQYSTLNGFLHMKNIDVYVTVSNSKMLSKDISTEFRGRGDVIY